MLNGQEKMRLRTATRSRCRRQLIIGGSFRAAQKPDMVYNKRLCAEEYLLDFFPSNLFSFNLRPPPSVLFRDPSCRASVGKALRLYDIVDAVPSSGTRWNPVQLFSA